MQNVGDIFDLIFTGSSSVYAAEYTEGTVPAKELLLLLADLLLIDNSVLSPLGSGI